MTEIQALQVDVVEQNLGITVLHEIVEDTANVYTVNFTFDEEWNGFVKTVILQNGAIMKFAILDDTNKLVLPSIIMQNGTLEIGIQGMKDGQSITTKTSDWVKVHRNGGVITMIEEPFEPTEYEKLMAELAVVRELAEGTVENAQIATDQAALATEQANIALEAKESVESMKEDVYEALEIIQELDKTALTSAQSAQTFAQDASTSEQNAYKSEVNANQSADIANEQAEIATEQATIAVQKATELVEAVETVTNLDRNSAGGIVVKANGSVISLVDASNKGLQSLTLYGKSTQDGTPTPEVPVEIVSVENPIVTISGDNSEQSLSLPYTLRGIPVTTGGNYTDEAGQQWICDTVELNGDGTGKLVQRIMCKIFDGTETLRNNWFPIMVYEIESPNFYANVDSDVTCNYFNHTYIGNVHGTTLAVGSLDKLGFTNVSEVQSLMLDSYNNGNPIVLQYALVTPIETELTAEEVAAFMALHTNKSNTTIFNSTGTNQTVEYTADTKLYIDNKIAELVAVQ